MLAVKIDGFAAESGAISGQPFARQGVAFAMGQGQTLEIALPGAGDDVQTDTTVTDPIHRRGDAGREHR